MFIINRFKKYLPYIIIILAGIGVAAGAYYLLNAKYGTKTDTKAIPVMAKAIGVHDVIKYSDMKIIRVDKSKDTTKYINNIDEAVGKVALNNLLAEEPIQKDSISESKILTGKEYVTIKIDYARTGGAKAGDIVDVYQVNINTGEWVSGTSAELLLKDITVVEITNSEGVSVNDNTESGIPLTKSNAKTEVVKLCVYQGQAGKLVKGSVDENSGIVLVVKGR